MSLTEHRDRLLAALQDVVPAKGREGQWRALCPCHEDHKPSLDITQRADKLLVGCTVCGANGLAVCKALDLPASTLFDGERQERPKRDGKLEASYVYRDADGQPYIRVLKFRDPDGSKRFVQQRREDGKWKFGLNGRPVLPYRPTSEGRRVVRKLRKEDPCSQAS